MPATTLPDPSSTRTSTADTGIHRAAVITAPRELEVRSVPVPELSLGHVLVRITHCGVCASNVPPWEGRPWFQYPMAPGALGHEASGTIEAVADDVTNWRPGDRVAYIGERGYAEFESVAASSLFALPQDDGLNFFLAEPLACAMNVFRRAGIRAGDDVAILGAGFLGTLLVQLAVAAGARVWAVGRRKSALGFAERHGAKPIVVESRAAGVEAIASVTSNKLCDVVIEATGHQEPLDLAAELTRVRGRLVIAGYHQDSPRPIDLQLWNWRGLDVINAHERDPAVYLEGMQLAREAIAEGRLTTESLITHVFPLEDLGTALNLAASRPEGFLKAVIQL
jgi:2-desacetyl-2-hydroxyethyl bacteriochlorophyllide A dehydrogenase